MGEAALLVCVYAIIGYWGRRSRYLRHFVSWFNALKLDWITGIGLGFVVVLAGGILGLVMAELKFGRLHR